MADQNRANVIDHQREGNLRMRLYIFRSGAAELRAFAADEAGSALPQSLAPWHCVGFAQRAFLVVLD